MFSEIGFDEGGGAPIYVNYTKVHFSSRDFKKAFDTSHKTIPDLGISLKQDSLCQQG